MCPRISGQEDVRTHRKEIIELSQDRGYACGRNTSLRHKDAQTLDSPPAPAKDYIASKLAEFRRLKALGVKIGKKELETDPQLDLSLSRAAREIVDAYQLRRMKDRHCAQLLKTKGKLSWNHQRLNSSLC